MFYVWGVQQLIYPIYNIALGLSPALIGIVIGIRTLWDAFTDPFMGHLSDRLRTRWGRRKPFMLVGIFASAFAFVAVWWAPAALPTSALFSYLLVSLLIFTTASTIYFVPYLALGYELTDDFNGRTALQAYRFAFMKIGSFAVPWLYFITQLDIFESTIAGMRALAIGAACLFLVSGLCATLFVKEDQSRTIKRNKIGFMTVLKQVGTNKTVLHFLTIILLLGQGVQIVNSLSLYVIIYYIFDGDKQSAAALYATGNSVYFIASFLAIPATAWLAKRIGKVRTFQISCAIVCVASLSKFFFFSPTMPLLIFIVYLMMAPGMSGFNLLRASMVADLVDEDQFQHGERREGVIAAIDQWSFKVTAALALMLTGLILQLSGFDASAGAQTEAVTTRLRIMFSVIPAVGAAMSFLIAITYPLTERRMNEIRAHGDIKV